MKNAQRFRNSVNSTPGNLCSNIPSSQRAAAKAFAAEWSDKGYEKGETAAFWMSLLHKIFGIADPAAFIRFESQVKLGHTSFIDAYIPATKVMIEQKGKDIDLLKPAKQSDGSLLTPYQQAKRYADELEYSKRPRWIIVCNFREFHVHDMEHPQAAPEIIRLADLPKEFHRLSFLTDSGNVHLKREMELSIKAGELVGKLYDAILARCINPAAPATLKSLNKLCVRLVFCLYAEDAGIFGSKNQFHDYLARFPARDLRKALIELFAVLDTPPAARDPYLDPELAAFPYVNGGLFADAEQIEIPQFDDAARELLLARASDDFDWSEISPTIFGAVFESTLNPETRRSGGMHYTSIENIHKVIDPLFLDALQAELAAILDLKVSKTRERGLLAFQEKIAALTFLDPACGSGNFLTETYLSLRRMENRAIQSLAGDGNAFLNLKGEIIKVSIGQFYGIEINDFAVSVAQAALWIAESQMMRETEEIVHAELDFLPLKSYANIVEGNALRMDWQHLGKAVSNRFGENPPPETSSEAVENRFSHFDYIMGNPPFVGAMLMKGEKRDEVAAIFPECSKIGEIDYVAGWYVKAVKLIENTKIHCAFVSTNSVVQGQQVEAIWRPLFERYRMCFNFAYRTFRWDSETTDKAAVHCVIIGFSHQSAGFKQCILFDENSVPKTVKCINGYLADAQNIFISNRSAPLCDVPKMFFGNMPRDGGGFILSPEEKESLVKSEPLSEKWIHPFVGAEEFINAKDRFCLWLVNANPSELKKCPSVLERVESVRQMRLASKAASTRKMAQTPTLFAQITQPPGKPFIIVPSVSSEKRSYVPIGFMDSETIASNLVFAVPDATLFHFGILTSSVHMAWMRAVCGRLEMRYRYSKDIVYNNFPWPENREGGHSCPPRGTQEQTASQNSPAHALRSTPHGEDRNVFPPSDKISQTAQGILDARALYPDCSLADLYDETTMPPELRRAHQANDRAVMEAYGFPPSLPEPEIVAALMRRYQSLSTQ